MQNTENWKEILSAKLPILGHRNWIVITDMAYPLQSGQGITTLFADEDYTQVLKTVKQAVDAAPHVFAHVYCDKELAYIPDADVPGIEALKKQMQQIVGNDLVELPHEEIISRLDESGRLFNVLIIKTPLTMPYTSLFFQLDCGYWDAERQQRLEKAMGK